MNSSTLKLLAVSLCCFLVAASLAAYVIYEQRKAGERIYSSLLYIKAWDALTQSGRTNEQIEEEIREKEKFKSIVLASESDTVRFLAMLDELSADTGVSIAATNLQLEKTREAGFDELEATFLLRGQRVAVEGILEVFELLPYRSHIVGLSLTRNPDGTAEASVSMVVSVKE